MEKPTKKPLIKWTEKEWDKLAIALHLTFPDKEYHIAEKLSLGVGQVMAIMRRTLDESQWRVLHTGNDYKPWLLKAFVRMRPTLVAHEANKEQAIAAVLTKEHENTELPIRADADSSDNSNSNETWTVPDKPKQSRIQWNEIEWMQLARELIKNNPQYLQSSTLVGVKLPDIQLAQKVLPENRRREGIIVMNPTRAKLLEAMAILRTEVQAQEATRKAQEAIEAEALRVASRNPFEVALEPLFALIKAEILRTLKPQLDSIQTALMQQAVSSFDPFPKEHVSSKPKKPKIAVIGAMPTQLASIALEFPQLDIMETDKDSPHVVSTVRNCCKVFGMTKFMIHAEDGKLKKELGDNYIRVAGGTSEVKRVIAALLTSGGIPKPAAQAAHH